MPAQAPEPQYGNILPPALPPPSTGHQTVDAALEKLREGRPYIYDKTLLAAATAKGPAILVPLLSDLALQLGEAPYSDARRGKLGPKERKAYDRIHGQVGDARSSRIAYLSFLAERVARDPAGRRRLVEIAKGPHDERVRLLAVERLLETSPEKATLEQLSTLADLSKWDGKGPDNLLVRSAEALFGCNPSLAFSRFSPLLKDVKGAGPRARAMALLRAMPETGLDPRWSGAIVALLDQPDAFLKMSAYDPLLALPADPRVIDPLLKGLGKNPAKASYVIDQIVQLLARVPEPRVLPYLAAALHASWPLYQTCFEAFRRAGDPAMVAEIRAWLEKHGDGPKGERTRLGNEVLAELEKKGPAPVSAATPAGEPKPAAPSKPKTLVFRKGPRPPKRERLEPIATQRKTLGEMFSEAGLAQHAEALIQPCLRLSSTRVELKALALGESRLGGLPDLPAGLAWPSVKKEPLTFVAQLDLAALERQLSKSPLPAKGQLAFFVSTDPDGEGGYLETAKVLFLAPGVKLVRRALPDGYEGPLFQACRLELVPMLKVPSSSHPRVTKRLKGEALSAYSDHVDLLQAPQHQVLGYRDHGYDSENPADAQLLFQCSSDPQADMTWGDVEELSFFIKEKDLAKGDFSKVWPYFGD